MLNQKLQEKIDKMKRLKLKPKNLPLLKLPKPMRKLIRRLLKPIRRLMRKLL